MKEKSFSGYNWIAPFYDDLAGLVFGQPLLNAQTCFFSEIPDNSNVLILGGGTGWVLPVLFQQKPNVIVWYVDMSEKMIVLSQKRKYPSNRVHFIGGTLHCIDPSLKFEAVILNFFVDGFTENQLPSILTSIEDKTHTDTIWLVSDFMRTPKRSHQFLLWLTHALLGTLVNNPNKRLVEWWTVFHQMGFRIKKERSWSKGLIRSVIYSRQ